MVQFISDYAPALLGLALGAVAGLILTAGVRRTRVGRQNLGDWDAHLTVPLLTATAVAHLTLLPVVERQRMLLFSLYALALFVTVAIAIAGIAIWRLGAIGLPAGSILAYAYFAVMAREADVVGLVVKVAELTAIAAALLPVMRSRQSHSPSTAT